MLNTILRRLMVYTCSGFFPLYIVTEYPKSGGTWLGQMLSYYYNVPFPRKRLPVLSKSILHGHYRDFPGMKNVFVVLRDGRDVMVSYYFHCLFLRDGFNNKIYERTKRDLGFKDCHDVESNLPVFIKYLFKKRPRFDFTWSQFIRNWIGRDAAFVRYENMLSDAFTEVSQAVVKISGSGVDEARLREAIEEYSFEKQSGRKQGQEDRNSFLRKGVAGDWKNYFTKESRELFCEYAGDELILAGYEKDDNWVEGF